MKSHDPLQTCLIQTGHGAQVPGHRDCPLCLGRTHDQRVAKEKAAAPPANDEKKLTPEQEAAAKAIEASIADYEAWKLRREALLEALSDFPFQPMGDRVVVMQKSEEIRGGAGLIVVPTAALAQLVGYIVAIPSEGDPTTSTVCPFELGDEVLYPDHVSNRVQIDVKGEPLEFLVMDFRDILGRCSSGAVRALTDIVPGLEDAGRPMTAEEIRAGIEE